MTEKKGFVHYSLSDEIRYETDTRNMTRSRDVFRLVGNDLRKTYGASVLAERAFRRMLDYKKASNVVFTAIRNPSEVEYFRKSGDFILVSVDAPVKIRYERILSRRREGEEVLSFEEFVNREELDRSGKEYEQQTQKVMDMADYVIINDGTPEELYRKVDDMLIAENI